MRFLNFLNKSKAKKNGVLSQKRWKNNILYQADLENSVVKGNFIDLAKDITTIWIQR
jgi:hypothetical protein